jgi:hypothetical protein
MESSKLDARWAGGVPKLARVQGMFWRGNEKSSPRGLLLEFGAGNRSRTYDLRITNALLYQLSYAGKTICFNFCVLKSGFHRRQRLSKTSLFFPVFRPVYGA